MKSPKIVFSTLAAALFSTQAWAGTYVVQMRSHAVENKHLNQLQAAGGSIRASLPQIGVVVVDSTDTGFLDRSRKIQGVRSVVADLTLQFDQGAPPQDGEIDYAASEDFANPPNSGDNDRFFDLQWGHAAIDAAGAWNQGYRGNGARVAVLDSGIFCNHVDIDGNLDLAASASFVSGEGVCNTPGNSTHGTHVAGTIAAEDNGIGTIGVAPQARVFAVKVLSARTGSGSFAGIIQGIVHAADRGADVINMSLGIRGGLNVGGNDVAELINATARATRYAESQNALIVVSAGNDGRDLDHDSGRVCDTDGTCTTVNLRVFPGSLPAVVGVSATGPSGWAKAPTSTNLDGLASYSNYGQSGIDFAAPGGDFDYPGTENCALVVGARPCWIYDMVMSLSSGPANYSWQAGTSMAAPHVSGVAALIIGKNGGEMAPSAVKQVLRASAEDLGKPGNDDAYGAGRVNASNAVR